MKIPISNTLYGKKNIFHNRSGINLKVLNETSFQKVNNKKFPSIKLIDKSTGELLLECTTGDKYHQLLLEVGLNAILEKFLNEKNKT